MRINTQLRQRHPGQAET